MGQPVCDVNFSQVSLLLHCDGTNGSTTFTDSSSVGNTMSVNGGAVIETTNVEFGTGSAQFVSASNSYIYTPLTVSGPLDLGNGGDWTIELWLNFGTQSAPGGVAHIIEVGTYNQSPNNYTLYVANGVGGNLSFTGPGITLTSNAYPSNTWFAWAVVCHNNSVQMYINGTAAGSSGTLTTRNSIGGGDLTVGAQNGTSNDPFNGLMDEIRITKGLARYTANYSPSGPFTGTCTPNVPNVVGQTTAAGTAAMVAAGYQVAVLQQNSNVVPGDIIISHAPTSGGLFPLNGVVTLTVSAGPAPTAGVGGDVWGAGGGGIVADNTRNPIAVALSAAQQPTNAVYQGNQSVLAAEANATLPLTMQTPAYTVPTTPTTG